MKNYIGNNNNINKKKYKKSLPSNFNPDAGNVEHNIDMFNKVSNVSDMPSSASGMNGVAESYQSREDIIAKLKDYGKNYNFSKYSDAQLYAMLNRLQNQPIRKKERQDRINLGGHALIDDPSYNFDDPDREGDYQVENLSIREALNRLDHKSIDEDLVFYDLRSLYENVAHQLSSQEKTELKNLLNTTSDPDAVKAYLDSKDPDKKKTEDLIEGKDSLTFDDLMKLADTYYMQGGSDIIEFWDKNSFNEYVKQFGPMSKETAIKLMKTMKAVSDDEEEAGRYWSKNAVESYSVQSNSTTDSVDVIDDETKRVVSRHRGENASDSANHEKDVLNMNEDLDPVKMAASDFAKYNLPLSMRWAKVDSAKMISEIDDDGYATVRFGVDYTTNDGESDYQVLTQKLPVKKYMEKAKIKEDLSDDWIDDDPSFDAFDTYSLQDKIFDFLDIISGDSNYDEMIEAVSDEFGMSPDKVEDYVNDYLRNKEAEWHDTADIDFDESFDEEDYYTRQISRNLGPSVLAFMNSSKVTNAEVRDAVSEFFDDYSKIPSKGMESLDAKYDCDKDRFYQKYRPFVDKCKKIVSELNPTGYGKTDYFDIKLKELLKRVDHNFPYGWKVYKGAADRQINEDYIESEDDWGDPYTYKDVYNKLSDLTNDFKDKKGTVRCWQEQEKIYGTKVLKKFYNIVEVSDGRLSTNDDVSWIISYSDLKDKDDK